MKCLTSTEIDDIIAKTPNKDKLLQNYIVSYFLDAAFYSDSFELTGSWVDLIVLTQYGQETLDYMHSRGIKFDDNIEKFVLLRMFYYIYIFIDFEKTDEKLLLIELQKLSAQGQIRWPYIYGNLLYHKFNDAYFGKRLDNLDATSVQSLLCDTPQGIFQIENIVSGPLGFISGEESRLILPTLNVHLWHCSDLGCKASHKVGFKEFNSSISNCQKSFLRILSDEIGPASDWNSSIIGMNNINKWPFGRPYVDLPFVISDCIIGDERKKLCLRLLRTAHNKMLNKVLYTVKSLKGPPEDIIEKITTEEIHQLLLLLPDRVLIEHIDELISNKEIKIPPSEVRVSKTTRMRKSSENDSELSSLGVRNKTHPPIIELAAQIWNTYEELGKSEDLAWRVRSHSGATLRHSVIDFIRSQGPEAAIKELILPSKEVTTAIGERLFFCVLPKESEKQIANRLIWKFGFNIARYEDDYILFRERIAEFKHYILQLSSVIDEKERAKVRSIGVNMFVSVEKFLEDLVCYNCWLLSSDHYNESEFFYTKRDALQSVSKTLGENIVSGEQTFWWCNEGNNTASCAESG